MNNAAIIAPAEVDYWFDSNQYGNFLQDRLEPSKDGMLFSIDMIKLSSIRRAISNFVCILTKQNIPVYFNSDKHQLNGKSVSISCKIHSKYDFDVVVGQALHEGAHIILTDQDLVDSSYANIPSKIFKLSDSKNIRRAHLEKFIKNIWNSIEDRYVDDYIFKRTPGYNGYYVAMYNRFWNSPAIDELLTSDIHRYPSLDSYEFRVINFTNPNTDLNALPCLEDIAKKN